MKLLVKFSFAICFSLFIFNTSYAQSKKRAPYHAIVITEDIKYHGRIAAINEGELVLTDKKDVSQQISYDKISSIKVFKTHGDIGYTVVTAALATGTIVAAQSIDDSNTAVLVGVGGTAAVVGLSMVLHNVIHGAEVKMKASKEKIDYSTVAEKLKKYVVNN